MKVENKLWDELEELADGFEEEQESGTYIGSINISTLHTIDDYDEVIKECRLSDSVTSSERLHFTFNDLNRHVVSGEISEPRDVRFSTINARPFTSSFDCEINDSFLTTITTGSWNVHVDGELPFR